MKKTLRYLAIVLFFSMLALSCEQSLEPENEKDTLVKGILSSEKFKRTGFLAEDLDLTDPQFTVTKAGTRAMVLRVKNQKTFTRIISDFDENHNVTGLTVMELRLRNVVPTGVDGARSQDEGEADILMNYEEADSGGDGGGSYIDQQYQNDQFTGELVFDFTFDNDPGHRIVVRFVNSLYMGKFQQYIGSQTSKCNKITEPGGAMDCAGTQFENMGIASKILCVIDFPVCMAALVIDCAMNGCYR